MNEGQAQAANTEHASAYGPGETPRMLSVSIRPAAGSHQRRASLWDRQASPATCPTRVCSRAGGQKSASLTRRRY